MNNRVLRRETNIVKKGAGGSPVNINRFNEDSKNASGYWRFRHTRIEPSYASILLNYNINGQVVMAGKDRGLSTMGSSAHRKTNDLPVINRPKSTNVTTETDAGISAGGYAPPQSSQADINNVCPLAFDVKLSNQTVPRTARLTLNDRALNTTSLEVVGTLTPMQHKIIQKCSKLGYEYNDIAVIDKKGVLYAEVKR